VFGPEVVVDVDAHISNEIEHDPSGQVNGLVAEQARADGQSRRDERQTPIEQAYGNDGGHCNASGHLSIDVAHEPEGHLTGVVDGQVDWTGHATGEITHVPSAGHGLVPVGQVGAIVHCAIKYQLDQFMPAWETI
jgi:hypothetical protein